MLDFCQRVVGCPRCHMAVLRLCHTTGKLVSHDKFGLNSCSPLLAIKNSQLSVISTKLNLKGNEGKLTPCSREPVVKSHQVLNRTEG